MQYVSFENVKTGISEIDSLTASVASGNLELSPSGVLGDVMNSCIGEFKNLTGYLVTLFALGILVNLVDLYGKKTSVSNTCFFAVYAAVASIGIQCYTVCLEYATGVIKDMVEFVTKLSPVLTALILTSGKTVTAAAFHPVLSAAVYIVSLLCNKLILPMASYSLILSVADNISDRVRLSGMCRILNSASKWILALSFTVFTGICGIYGFSSPGIDALSAKTVKFAVGSLIPVVGGFLSETLETVVSGSLMMKNAVGVAGVIALCTVCAVPVIKIGMMAVVMRIASAVTETVGDTRVSKLMGGISSAVTTLFGLVATVAVLFIINISIILATTGQG